VREAAQLAIGEDERCESGEVEEVATSAAEYQSWNEEDEQIALGRQREAEEEDGGGERDRERHGGEQRGANVDRLAWWAPALAAGVSVGLAVGLRAPFWRSPLTADEGGYAEVARLWDRGAVLYHGIWVDRPQGLLLTFRALLHVGDGSSESIRLAAAVFASAALLATMVLSLRWGGRIVAVATGLESFTLAGELVAWLPTVLALLAFTAYLRSGRIPYLVLTGLLAGCAVMIKQSAFDAALAAVLLLVLERRRGAARPVAVLTLSALVPVAIAAALAPHFDDWWHAIVAYRAQADSLVTGSFVHRLHRLAVSLPAAAKGLALLAVLAAAGWRSAPLLAKVWFAAAVPGVLGGGNFHPHYYLQLVPPLAVLGGFGIRRLIADRSLRHAALAGAVTVATLAVTVPLWFASGTTQARAIWPDDPHLVHQARLADFLRTHTQPMQTVDVLWAGADVHYLADRRPTVPYLWYRNIEAVPGALALARRMLVERKPALVLVLQHPDALDRSGRTSAILRRYYRRFARVDGTTILQPRPLTPS
jgi:hypothetical protein